jgi:hypothetical protein
MSEIICFVLFVGQQLETWQRCETLVVYLTYLEHSEFHVMLFWGFITCWMFVILHLARCLNVNNSVVRSGGLITIGLLKESRRFDSVVK